MRNKKYQKYIVPQKGSIDNLVSSLGIKKSNLYRKEEGAVISNKTMKLINDGDITTLATYKKLQEKNKLQQGIDFHFENNVFNKDFKYPVFTSSFTKEMFDELCLRYYGENRFEDALRAPALSRLPLRFLGASFRDSCFKTSVEKFKLNSKKEKEVIKELEYFVDNYMSILEAESEENEVLFYDDYRTNTFMYAIENPDRFYDFICMETFEKRVSLYAKPEWLIDRDISLARCSLDEEEKLIKLQNYCSDPDIKVNNLFFKKVLNIQKSQSLDETIKKLITLIIDGKNITNQTATTDVNQLLKQKDKKTLEDSFWLNSYILALYGCNLYFKKIFITEEETEGLNDAINFQSKSKFIFYFSFDDIQPVLFFMPYGYTNFKAIPKFQNTSSSVEIFEDKIPKPSKEDHIAHLKRNHNNSLERLKDLKLKLPKSIFIAPYKDTSKTKEEFSGDSMFDMQDFQLKPFAEKELATSYDKEKEMYEKKRALQEKEIEELKRAMDCNKNKKK
jgi:hypothetical protein